MPGSRSKQISDGEFFRPGCIQPGDHDQLGHDHGREKAGDDAHAQRDGEAFDRALAQLEQVYLFRKNGARASFSTTLSDRLPGVFATAWISAREFMDTYQAPAGGGSAQRPIARDTVETFKRLFAEIRKNSTTA